MYVDLSCFLLLLHAHWRETVWREEKRHFDAGSIHWHQAVKDKIPCGFYIPTSIWVNNHVAFFLRCLFLVHGHRIRMTLPFTSHRFPSVGIQLWQYLYTLKRCKKTVSIYLRGILFIWFINTKYATISEFSTFQDS